MKCLGLGNDLKVIKVSINERTKKMTTPQTYISILGHTQLKNNNEMTTRFKQHQTLKRLRTQQVICRILDWFGNHSDRQKH